MEQGRIDDYWNVLQEKVFNHCIDERDGAGNVRSMNEAQCQVRRFLPNLVNIVDATHSDSIEPYLNALRKTVCVKCEYAKPDGSCEERRKIDCCLDRYFLSIVEAIESVNARHTNRHE